VPGFGLGDSKPSATHGTSAGSSILPDCLDPQNWDGDDERSSSASAEADTEMVDDTVGSGSGVDELMLL
jgi:hypothetical protein